MDFSISDDEQAVADLARRILEDHATNERHKQLEAEAAAFDERLWAALRDASLLGTAVPEAYGGTDLGFFPLCLLLQEVGRTVARVPAYASLVLGGLPLARFGDDAQRETWLPRIARGEAIVTAALTEYESSDPFAPATRATGAEDGEVIVSGTKSSVPFAEQASRILIPARRDDGSTRVYLVDPKSEGVELEPQSTSDRHPHGQVRLRDLRVTSRDAVGGGDTLAWLVQRAMAARCMMQLGVTERALEMTAAYTRDRVQFDRPIGSFQAVHQRAADAYINVEAVRLTALEAAWRLSRDLPAEEHVAVAKFWAAEGGQFAAYACQHLHGGVGIDVDYPLHRHFIWATQIEHELGSAKHQLDRLGRRLAAGELTTR